MPVPRPELEEDERPGSQRIRRAHSDRERKKEMRHRERHVIKEVAPASSEQFAHAKILRTEGAYFIAEREDGTQVRVRSIKGTVSGNPNASLVAVGDAVLIEDDGSDVLVIREVLPRRTKLSRRAHKRRDSFEQVIAANVDLVAVVSSASDPPFRPGIIDRYIVAALEGELGVLLVVNKADEMDPERGEFVEMCLEYYKILGYDHVLTSATTLDGVETLRAAISGKTVVFAGKSGVGKSSLVNALVGTEIARTRRLMKKAARGVHTTTNATMIPLPEEHTYIVDTPGVKEFFHFELEPDRIRFHFVEFAAFADKCKMTNCMHIHEPGCAVSEAVDEGLIPEWRMNSYAALWEDAERERKARVGGM